MALLAILAIAWLVREFIPTSRNAQPDSRHEPVPTSEVAIATVEGAGRVALESSAGSIEHPVSVHQTARAFLAEYWGARWNEIEQAMIAAKVNLDVPFEFIPWETARDALSSVVLPGKEHLEGQIQGRVQWPAELTVAWLTEYLGVSGELAPTDTDLVPIEEIAAPFNDQLQILASEWGNRLDFNVRAKWNSGDFVKAPFSTFGVSQQTGFYSTSAAGHGWAVLLVLTNEDCPDMVALMNEITGLRAERDRAILGYLSNRFK